MSKYFHNYKITTLCLMLKPTLNKEKIYLTKHASKNYFLYRSTITAAHLEVYKGIIYNIAWMPIPEVVWQLNNSELNIIRWKGFFKFLFFYFIFSHYLYLSYIISYRWVNIACLGLPTVLILLNFFQKFLQYLY